MLFYFKSEFVDCLPPEFYKFQQFCCRENTYIHRPRMSKMENIEEYPKVWVLRPVHKQLAIAT